jgi:hypothetical protein
VIEKEETLRKFIIVISRFLDVIVHNTSLLLSFFLSNGLLIIQLTDLSLVLFYLNPVLKNIGYHRDKNILFQLEIVCCRSNHVCNNIIMLSNERQRQHRSLLHAQKMAEILKQSTSGTLSPDTTTTTSSGYSTGGSSISATIIPSLKKSSSSSIAFKEYQQQHKTKSKGKRERTKRTWQKKPIATRSGNFDSIFADDIFYIFLIYAII